MKQWIKLYIEILDDPKMGRLPDRLFRRAIELFLMAGKADNNDGVLPPVEDIAWLLRVDEATLLEDLRKLEEVNIVHEDEPGIWIVTHFSERQDADTPAERVANHRRRTVTKRFSTCNDDVTKRYNSSNETETNSYVEEDKEAEEESESEAEVEAESEAEAEIATAGTAATKIQPVPEQNTTQKTAIHDLESEKQAQIGAVFREYEANIGVLTPFIADRIGDLLDHYPRDWISAAFREAVAHEARNLKYVEAILKRWKTEGFQSRKNGAQKARDKPQENQPDPEDILAELEKKR